MQFHLNLVQEQLLKFMIVSNSIFKLHNSDRQDARPTMVLFKYSLQIRDFLTDYSIASFTGNLSINCIAR